MPAVVHSQISAGALCPSCDPRAIGLPDDGSRRWVYKHTLVGSETLFRCGACGCHFNPGTTRAYGPKVTPLKRETVNALIKSGVCSCGEDAEHWRSYDLNYIDDQGVEQRVHGWVCRRCGRWAQYG